MSQKNTVYRCQDCGYQTTNWMGRCSSCGNWNTFIKYNKNSEKDARAENEVSEIECFSLTGNFRNSSPQDSRINTGMSEFNRVLGGGVVPGSLVLLGGSPGVGKSTLILQIASFLADKNLKILYISGEESGEQLAMRAERLQAFDENIKILTETLWQNISSHVENNDYDFIIVDSIQTVYDSSYQSSPGSVMQVKEVTASFQQVAKNQNIPVFLIGHVTKQGQLAGPKVMEHMVDTVLYFQENSNSHRLLKAHKNRFGATDEVGVFAMREDGLQQINNPSSLFLEGRPNNCSGSVVAPINEGSRTILVEIQALVSSGNYGHSRRITSGVNKDRANLLLAVIDKRLGLNLAERDVHFNIVGGLEVNEPALDLALAASVISSYFDIVLPADLLVFGEMGLAGEVRSASQSEKRIMEGKKMGFKRVLLPEANSMDDLQGEKLNFIDIDRISALLKYIKSIETS